GLRSEYQFTRLPDGSAVVSDQRAGTPDGTDTLADVELLQFADGIFDFSGLLPPLAPEIAVLGNGINITDGATTPGTSDLTDFGSVTQGGAPVQHSFTVRNDGGSTLTTSGLVLPSGFSLVEGLSSSIAPNSSDTFTIQLDTTSTGTKSGQISFATNDSNENPFNFSITGTVNTAVTPLRTNPP